jgi:demethylmenaquinone methyltransferase/2-methoxy-6-polyprenyl-1,4-benzoquinol methylase
MNPSLSSRDHRQRFFDREAPGWDTLCEDYTQTDLFHEWFAGLDLQPGQRLLEIGCGTGRVLSWLKRAAGPSGAAIGLDFSFGMLNESRRRLSDGAPRGKEGNFSGLLIQGEARSLPFSNQSFNHIFILNTFPHLEPRNAVLSELQRILRPGGALHIVHFCGREFVNRIHAEAGEEVREDRLPHAKTLGAILESLGFRVFSVEDREDFYQVRGVRR